MSEFFSTLLELSFKGSFLIFAIVLLRLIFRKAPRKIICLLWILVGLRLIAPFSVESSLSLVPQPHILAQESSAPTVEAVLPDSIPSAAPESSPNPGIIVLPQTGTVTLPQSPSNSSNLPAPIVPPQTAADTAPEISQKPLPTPMEAAAMAWVCGAAVMVFYALLSYLLLRRSVREAVPAGRAMRQCAGLESPFVLGLFRPKIYVPFGIPETQLQYILAHEKAHIARGDHWTKLIGFLVLSLHWFNPLVWLGYGLMCRDMELACDEKVIRGMDSHERKDYSLALLNCAVKASPLAACPLAFGEVGVKLRIKSVLSYKKPALWIIIAALVLGIATGVFFLTDPKEKEAFDCPEEVLDVIYDYMDSQPHFLRYKIRNIKELNEYLYSFSFDARIRRRYGPETFAQYGFPPRNRDFSAVYYAYYLDGKWQISPEFSDVPMHILRGEESEVPPSPNLEGTKGNVSEFPLTDIYPDTPVGIGVNLIYDDENTVIFQAEHGLFAYSLAERRMILAMDTVKAVGIAGFQGSIPVAGVSASPDGNTIQLYHTSHKDQCFYIDTYTGDYHVAPYEEFPDNGDGDRVIDRKSFIESYGVSVGCFADQYYGAHRGTGERIPLFADFPFATTATAELPVEAHIMDKLRFYLPVGWSTGFYDLFLSGTGSGVAIYDSWSEKVGSMELSFAVKPEFSGGEIVFADDGENHALFREPFESIDHSIPCAIGRHVNGSDEESWFIVFASPEQKGFCYVLRLDTGMVDRATAIAIAKTVRITAWGFEPPDESEMPYWPIIDAYASAVAAGLEPIEFQELGLNPSVAIAAGEMGRCASMELCYDIWDLDGDGQKELHIVTSCNTDSFYYAMLMALYTIDERGEAVKVLESSERARYCFAGGNRLVYHGASSAFDSVDEMYRYKKGELIFDGNAPEEGGFPIRIAMPSSGIRPFSRIDLPYSPASPTGPYVDISSYAGLSIYTPEIGYTYAIEAETYIAQIAAITGSGGLSSIHESEYMEAAASAPLTLIFESRNAGESVSLFSSPVSTYPKLCVETPEGCFYFNVAGDGLQPARELLSHASEFSVNGSSFYYRVPELGLLEYDMTEYVANMDVISSARSVKDKLVLECHTGPKNAVYLIFDTQSRSFEKEIIGANLTWYGDMLASAVYSFWESVYNYHGGLIKEYELEEDEFIRSLEFSENGRSLIVSIEGGGRIRQDIIPILNDNSPRLSMSSDLDKDGSDDSISLHGDGGLYINGRGFLTGLGAADMESLSLYSADIDPEDSFLELAISRGGSDAESMFFRWDGQDVRYLGSIPAEYEDIEFREAYCVAAFHCEVLPGWMLRGHWVVQDGELVLTNGMNSGMHYLFTRSSYELNEQGEPMVHRLKSSLVVYDGNEKPTNSEVLPADSTIALMGCDNVEWLRIMSDNGASYWLHVVNGMVDTPNGSRPIGEIIEGLN